MGGGLMELVAKGAQDIYLTGNPNVTYFKSVFKRHTNFSMESIQQSFSGDLNFGKKITSTIKRTGDLLSGITLEIDLPAIESKRGNVLKWTNSIGHTIIDNVQLEIGGTMIDRQYGEWMDIWSELTTDESHVSGLKTMVGKNTSTQGTLANEKKKLIVPLQFWFCKNIGLALPLVSLQYHEVKLNITLRPFSQCWKKPVKRYYVQVDSSNTNRLNITSGASGDFNTSFLISDIYNNQKLVWESDGIEQRVNGRIDSDTIELSSTNTAGKSGYVYLVLDEPDKNYSLEDIRLYCDYIYLDTNERKFFAENTHIYLIEQVQFNGNVSYQTSQDSNKIAIEFNHPCKELLWVTQMDLSKTFNEHLNFSNSVDITYGDNPIKNTLLYINGQERFSQRNADHFRLEIPFKRHTRVPDNFIYVYSFSLKPEQMQPSGTCNFSILDSAELLINYSENLPASNTRVYGLSYNILNIKNGMGGVAYSN
jgi:hypothetical protein